MASDHIYSENGYDLTEFYQDFPEVLGEPDDYNSDDEKLMSPVSARELDSSEMASAKSNDVKIESEGVPPAICEDCGQVFDNPNKLVVVAACANENCCTKNICPCDQKGNSTCEFNCVFCEVPLIPYNPATAPIYDKIDPKTEPLACPSFNETTGYDEDIFVCRCCYDNIIAPTQTPEQKQDTHHIITWSGDTLATLCLNGDLSLCEGKLWHK